MFGSRKVYVYERPTAADIFSSIVLFLVIAGIIAILAFWIGLYILFIFLGIGAAVGLCYALFVYIRALVRGIRSGISYTPHASGALIGVLEKYFYVAVATSSDAFADSISMAGNALARAHGHRFISFFRWMWLIAALSIVVFGIALIAAVVVLQFLLLVWVACAALGIALVLCAFFFIAALGYGNVVCTIDACTAARDELDLSSFGFNSYVTFHDLGYPFGTFFPSLGRAIARMWSEFVSRSQNNISSGMYRPVYSVVKWFYLVSPAGMAIWTALFSALAAVFDTLFFFLAYLALFVFTCFARLISLIRH